jgi:hypothetical protein
VLSMFVNTWMPMLNFLIRPQPPSINATAVEDKTAQIVKTRLAGEMLKIRRWSRERRLSIR